MANMEMLENSDIYEIHETLSTAFMRELSLYHLRGICSQKGLIELNKRAESLDNQLEITI